MKTSLVVSTPGARFSALVFRDSFSNSLARAASLGFDGVELAVRDPRLVNPAEIARLAEEHRLKVCAIGTGQAYGEDGLSFTDPDPSVRERAIHRIREHLALAGELRAIVILGLIRGKRPPEMPEAEARRLMICGFEACAEAAAKLGVDMVIEPINRDETNLLNTVGETLEVLDELGSPHLGILLDTFHMNIEEPSIAESIRAAGNRIKHVHAADSNRWAPGFGHLDFHGIVRELRESGYEGFLSAEILPYPDPDTAARRAVETLAEALKSRGAGD